MVIFVIGLKCNVLLLIILEMKSRKTFEKNFS